MARIGDLQIELLPSEKMVRLLFSPVPITPYCLSDNETGPFIIVPAVTSDIFQSYLIASSTRHLQLQPELYDL